MLERDGWVFSSQPISLAMDDGGLVVERRRQAVSPAGEIEESTTAIALDVREPGRVRDARRASPAWSPWRRREIPETLDHIGSTVVICRR